LSQFRLSICVAACAVFLFSFAAQAAPRIELTSAGLRATGITPGGDAVWFGLTVDSFAMSPRLNRHAEIVRDADGDGVVPCDAPKITRFTLMFVADATTGEYAAFRAEGVDAIEHDLRGNNWRAGLEHFDVPADFLEILLVRPAEGAWKASVFEGHREDGDGKRNGKFRLKLKDLEPIGETAGKLNGNVRRGDLLVLIDPRSFACAVRAARD
jgi:hypothetical protein